MLHHHLIATSDQKVLSLLAKLSGRDFYERQVARRLGISYGSANRALNKLYSTGFIVRRREGKMYFYTVNSSNPITIEFKKLVNMILLEPLVEELKNVSNRAVLYGSCAQGVDTSESDIDLFIVSDDRERVMQAIDSFNFPQGFEDIKIQPVVKSSTELLEAREPEQAFLNEVEQGIVLWEKVANEPRV